MQECPFLQEKKKTKLLIVSKLSMFLLFIIMRFVQNLQLQHKNTFDKIQNSISKYLPRIQMICRTIFDKHFQIFELTGGKYKKNNKRKLKPITLKMYLSENFTHF